MRTAYPFAGGPTVANALKPLIFTQGVVAAAGTSVAPGTAIPDNCTQVILLNTSTTIPALFGIATPGGALTEGTNSTRLPASTAITLSIGTIMDRGVMDNGVTVGSGIVYDAVGGAATVDITYVCVMGSI